MNLASYRVLDLSLDLSRSDTLLNLNSSALCCYTSFWLSAGIFFS